MEQARHTLHMEGWEPTVVDDFAQASAIFITRRDESGRRPNEMRDGYIEDPTGKRIGNVSYNGRVWKPGKVREGDRPIWDSRDPDALPRDFPVPSGGWPQPRKAPTPPAHAKPKNRHSGHPPGELSLRQQAKLDLLHSDMLGAIEAMRRAGVSLDYDGVVHLFVKAHGQSDIGQLKWRLVHGQALKWDRNRAAAALVARHGLAPEVARRAADEALMDHSEHATTLTEIEELVADHDPRVQRPLPRRGIAGGAVQRLAEAGVTTVAGLLEQAGSVRPDDLEAALDAISMEWSGGHAF